MLVIKETAQGKNCMLHRKVRQKKIMAEPWILNDKDGPIGTSDRRRKDTRILNPLDGSFRATNQDGHIITTVVSMLDESDSINHDGHCNVGRIR